MPHPSDDWRGESICARHPNPDLWFEENAPAEAVALCRTCPVIGQCLTWALSVPSLDGVAGGLTGAQRRTARRRTRNPDRRKNDRRKEKAA
jgi:WhiB family redox-sensing transcriptional regulator